MLKIISSERLIRKIIVRRKETLENLAKNISYKVKENEETCIFGAYESL